MLVVGGLGFQSLVLVPCLLFPLIVFLIRRKWRLAIVRKEEVRRLLALAAEEAARVELEESFVYIGVAISGTQNCAVCYSPTTTRCARCKSVRYCSGKCQIIHWRRGHKEECFPPTEAEFKSNNGCFTEALGGKNDEDTKSEFFIEERKTDLGSESPATSFSGFSSSLSRSESSDNLSDSEGSIQTSNERCGEHLFSSSSFDNLEKIPGIIMTDDPKLSPKFAALVDSVDSCTESTKLNRQKLTRKSQDSQSISNSSGSGSNGKCVKPCTFRSDVGRVDTDLIGSKNNAQANATFSGFNIAKKDNSNWQSSLCFSSDPAGYAVPSQSHVLKANNIKFDKTLPTSSKYNKLLVRQTVSDDTTVDYLKVSNSLYNHEMSKETNNSISCRVNSQEGKSVISSSSTEQRNSRNVCDSNTSIPPPSRSEKLTEVVYDQSLSSSIGSQIVPPMHSGKVNSNQARTFSQDSISFPNSMNGLKTSVSKVFDQLKGSKSKYVVTVDDKTGRPCSKGIFSYELFVKLYNWNKVELLPSGLINCGNSCYANAVLQCLAFTPPLTAYFLHGFHSETCRKRGWCFSCDFEKLILKMNEGKSPLSPATIISQLRNIGSQLSNGREEDAHEFLRYVIDTMQSVSLVDPGVSGAGLMEEETSLIGLTFGGYLLSKIECTKCHGKSECQERILDLTVEIEGDIGTLEEALRQYTSTEVLDENNKYQCSRCKSYVRAKKKLTVLEAPNVLTIALKRFQSGKFGKLNKPIKFPDILNLAPFLSGTSDKSPIYKLYAVIDHLDVMNAAFSGHYVCYVKNVLNKWFKIDDSTVTAVEPSKVLTKGAYMLFYSRCSPRAPKLTRNRILTSDPKIKISHSPIKVRSNNQKSRSIFTRSISHGSSGSDSPLQFHGLQSVLDDDSFSDSSSLFSTNSDEGSTSSYSTHNSSSSFDDLSDYIFGNSGHGLKRDSTSSNYDPSSFHCTHLPLPDRPEKSRDRLNSSELKLTRPSGRSEGPSLGSSGGHGLPFLPSNLSRTSRKTDCSETDSGRSGYHPLNFVKSGGSLRKSADKRPTN